MNRYDVPLPAPNAVAAGATSAFDLPTDRRYHGIYLNYKGTANQTTIQTDITEIRLKVGNTIVRRFSATQLNLINASNGKAFTAGYIPIFFSEPWGRTPGDEDIHAWGMSNVRTFQLEVDIAGGATSPTLGGFVEVDDVQENFEGIVSWYTNIVDVSSTGVKQFRPEIDKGRELLKALHMIEASDGDITNVRVALDRFEIYNLSAAENSKLLSDKGITDQTAMISFRPDRDRRVANYLPLVKQNGAKVSEFRVDATMGSAASFTYLLEAFGTPIF